MGEFEIGRCNLSEDRQSRMQKDIDKLNETVNGKDGIWHNIGQLDNKITKLVVYAGIAGGVFAIIGAYFINNMMDNIYKNKQAIQAEAKK